MLWTTLVMALRQLWRNKVRTALTSLGILIGVAAVIAMVSIGTSATRSVESDLSSLGDDMLFVVPGSQRGGTLGRPLTHADVAAVRQLPRVDLVAPMGQTRAVAALGDRTWNTEVQGSAAELLTITGRGLQAGRLFDGGEELSGADVCVVGQTVVEELFGSQDPLGQEIRVGALTCEIVGVAQAKGQNTFGMDQDDFVFVPLTTFERRLQGNRDVSMIFVRARDGERTDAVKADLEALLAQRRHVREGAEPDFTVRDMRELASMLGNVSKVLTGFLAAIAGVSLLVGGIGIMNIMLVSVTERTREIGIRLAVGALARDVLIQFLVEAMVLAGVGGTIGIGLGLLLSWGAAAALGVTLVVQPAVVGLAFLFSALIGVVFGFFPARRAARMKPIDALRHE